jgi:hypothetical protein
LSFGLDGCEQTAALKSSGCDILPSMKHAATGDGPGSSEQVSAEADRADREQDFYAWLIAQARALRTHQPAFLDWAGIAEELESMAASEKRELKSRLIVLTAHLLKWRYASAQRPLHEASWRKTIREQRRALNDLLADNLSLKGLPHTLLESTSLYREHVRPDAVDDTGLDIFPAECPWTVDLILAADFWPEA